MWEGEGRVITQYTSMDVKGTCMGVGSGTVSTQCMVMWAVNTKEVYGVIGVIGFERFGA